MFEEGAVGTKADVIHLKGEGGKLIKLRLPQTKLFIGNYFVDSSSGNTIDVLNPSTEKLICTVPAANEIDVHLACEAAKKAFDHGPWRGLGPEGIEVLLMKLADLIETHKEEIAALESLDTGKPYKVSLSVDVSNAIHLSRYFASLYRHVNGRVVTSEPQVRAFTKREPVGIVAG